VILSEQTKIVSKKFKDIFRYADFIQCISNYLANWAKNMGAKCNIEVIPNGVDLNRFKRIESLDYDSKEKVIITTSRLVKKNAVDDIIKSLSYLSQNIKLWILGDGAEKDNLKKLVIEKGLKDRVIFGGFVKNNELPVYLSKSNVFIRPSLSEGLGNSFLEAMAVGIPVLGTKVGGIPDFLEEGKTGWFVEVRNPKSIAEKVKFVLDPDNKEMVEKICSQARKMVEERYDWNKIAAQIEHVFNDIG
jgi:glycosyltransferase involved in cell wall biosynthesis